MIDIGLVRKDPDFVRKNLERRHIETPLEKLIGIDIRWREDRANLDALRNRRNVASAEIAALKKEKKDAGAKISEMKTISDEITGLEKEIEKLDGERNGFLLATPNILDESVPDGRDSANNVVLRKWGDVRKPSFKLKGHTELIEEKGLADIERAARATGARFYYLKGDLFRLALALETFTIDFLTKKGFLAMETPFMLKREAIQGAISMADFGDVIFKVDGEDLYLIGTAEHTLLAYHMGEIFEPGELPKLYCGYSTNFRKEAGAHGKDMKGIFRVRQFDKVEQFIFCKPEESPKWHEALIENAELLFQALLIPYRVIVLCGGDTGRVSAKTYDLEAWMPAQDEYREVVSASNCTDYQARRLNIRYRTPEGTRFPHTLNSTAIAIQRTLVGIIENYQTEDGGIVVPEVLRPYMNGRERIG